VQRLQDAAGAFDKATGDVSEYVAWLHMAKEKGWTGSFFRSNYVQ